MLCYEEKHQANRQINKAYRSLQILKIRSKGFHFAFLRLQIYKNHKKRNTVPNKIQDLYFFFSMLQLYQFSGIMQVSRFHCLFSYRIIMQPSHFSSTLIKVFCDYFLFLFFPSDCF